MDAVPLRPLQRSMSRESTETSHLVDPDRPHSGRDDAFDEEDVDSFIAGQWDMQLCVRMYRPRLTFMQPMIWIPM